MNGGTYVTVFMMPSNQPLTRAAERTALLLAVFAIIGFAFLAWALSIFKLVIRHRLNDTQKQTFQPRTVYRRAAVFLISEMLVVAGVSVFLQCLFANSYVSAVTEETLRALDTCIATEKAMTNAYQSVQMDNYEAAAETVGMLVSSKGDALNPAVLDSACEAIGADYIIIYDETGAQVMSNTAYSGLSLALGGEDMQDFSRLLKGVSPISKARVTDAQTARTHAVFAVSLARSEDGAQPGPYWAMLLFVNPDEITGEALGPAEDFLQSDSFSDSLCFSLDPDSGEILSSSKQDFVGKNAVSLGLPEDALTDHYKGFFWMVDDLVYGVSAKMNGALYYDIISQHLIYQNVPLNTLRGVAIYLCLMALLAVFLLSGYGKVFARYADRGEYLPEEENLVMTSSGRLQESVDPSRRWRFFEPVLGSRAPIRNAYQAGEAVFMLSVIVAVLYAQFGRSGVSDSAMAYILSGRWSRGFNLFAIASILFLFVVICVFTIICKFVIALATRNAGTKGETIGRLLLDFIRYVSVIVFAYYALSFVGVDTAALLASLGIITFALSLGAQDLIRDILAGLSIVMEGEYQVGDIIEVGGFRGTVLAIGVRTTKIEGRGGNILIMGNRDVKNVINRTRKNSWYALDISISETEDLSKVEALLTDQLPQIGKAIPEIISGPFYKGVVNIGRGTFGLSIIAECMEEDYYRVQRQLNGAIAVFFEEHGIQIK